MASCLAADCIGRLADLADKDRCAGLLGHLLAVLLGHLATLLPGHTHTLLLRNLNMYKTYYLKIEI